MNRSIHVALRVGITALIVAGAAYAGKVLWFHYREAPWTRDGRVRAEVVQVAPDVSGLVEKVLVHDNQTVRQGDLLFTIDTQRYRFALAQAQGAAHSLQAQIEQTRREDARNRHLGELVPDELREQSASKLDQLRASLTQAVAAAETAKLNLERTQVRAPVDGWITNFELRPGSYATAGRPLIAVVDGHSLHVVGYFEETKIPRIHVGDAAHVRMIGEAGVLSGRVQGIAAAIDDRERQGSANLLANVNPTFNWVRIAQRIPVRIELDGVPQGVQLIMGRTATVEIAQGGRP
jgi:RND family efflux transporter MFP subunit